jgi:hypothetical protein
MQCTWNNINYVYLFSDVMYDFNNVFNIMQVYTLFVNISILYSFVYMFYTVKYIYNQL